MIEYVELHAHSDASLCDGACRPEVLVERARELGMRGLAITDHDNVYAAVKQAKAAAKAGIRPIFGSELTLDDGSHLTLLVENATGWENLCQLITRARHNRSKGEAALPSGVLEHHTQGLIALSGCRRGKIASALLRGDRQTATAAAHRYSDLFGKDRFYLELQQHLLPQDTALVDDLVAMAGRLRLPYVATNNVHYALPEGQRLQDTLIAIKNKGSYDEAGLLLRPNDQYYLKSPEEMAHLFRRYPDAISNTLRIAEQSQFELRFGLQELPAFPTPDGMSAAAYLKRLCYEGLRQRGIAENEAARRQLDAELDVIESSGLSNYFLILWDIVRYAREQGILYQARGSIVNSLVAYVLFISPINPLDHNLVFERFLSPERQILPDADMDFAADRREEIIQYICNLYGDDHAAMACTYSTFQARSAVRDIGKALGLPPEKLAQIAKAIDTHKASQLATSKGFQEAFGGQRGTELWKYLTALCGQIDGLTRHLSIHSGGMVVMGKKLSSRVPTEPARKQKRTVVQWDKDSLADAGLIKIDILSLEILAAIAKAVKLVQEIYGKTINLDQLTFDDPAVYAMISRADTIGVFQVESRAQQQLIRRLKPRRFFDLILAISLIRPGPIMGNMVHPFMKRWLGQEPVRYPHPLLEEVLRETNGVILWQEQILKIVHVFAGFSLGQGELLRRALGSKRSAEEIEKFHDAFVDGAQAKGVSKEIAEEVFNILRAFGGYAFAKSHAAAFAVIVYWSAWLKCYYPAALTVGILNSQPMGFWPVETVVNDAKRHGISVLPVEVNNSQSKCTIEGDNIRLGFNYVNGFGDKAIDRVMTAKANEDFADLQDFCRRTRLSRRLVERLILAGAMDGWNKPRRRLLWELNKAAKPTELKLDFSGDDVELPGFTEHETMAAENALLGVMTGDHIMTLYQSWMAKQGILDSRQLEKCKHSQQIRVAGLYIMRQSPPTAKGVVFLVLEDANGLMDAIVYPKVYARYWRVLRQALHFPVVIEGQVQREGDVINVICRRVELLPSLTVFH